jgi:hypothetical protein
MCSSSPPFKRDRWLFNFFKEELGYVTSYISDIGYSNANWFSRSPFEFASSWIDRYSWTATHKLLAPFLHPSLPLYSSNSVSRRGRWCFGGQEQHIAPLKVLFLSFPFLSLLLWFLPSFFCSFPYIISPQYLFEFHNNYQKKGENFQLSVTHINGPHDRTMRMLANYDKDFTKLLREFER